MIALASPEANSRAGLQGLSRCCRALPMDFLQCCFLLFLSSVPTPVLYVRWSLGLWLLIISSTLLRSCLLIFLPLVKPSLLASHRDLFSYLLLLFAYYKSGSREKFCIKMKGNLKNELVMRAINQSSLQHQHCNCVGWREGDWMRGLMRNKKHELFGALMRQPFTWGTERSCLETLSFLSTTLKGLSCRNHDFFINRAVPSCWQHRVALVMLEGSQFLWEAGRCAHLKWLHN